jgi:hypothetical protein
VLTWLDDQGVARASERLTVLLPIVLTAGGNQTLEVAPTTLPPPGTYITTLRLHDAEGLVVGRQRVVVAAPESPERDSPSAGGDLAHPG